VRIFVRAGMWKLVLLTLALWPVTAWAQGGTATPGSGLSGSAHDFTNAGVLAQQGSPLGDVGLCTFCHTPHKALSTALLWNHTLSTNNFHWDIPATTAGTLFPTFLGNTYKGPTAKCLSCHDGSVAIGDVAWFAESSQSLQSTKHNSGEFNVGLNGNMAGNHPVAMPYPFNQTPSTYNGTTTGAGFVPTEWVPDPTTLATAKIRLFQDDGAGNITAGPTSGRAGLECSSCHDPHNKQAVEDLFLRGKLIGNTRASGYLCVQCHIKDQ
jgi:Doubled CXXCH motif (Paired_CXXCH_1)